MERLLTKVISILNYRGPKTDMSRTGNKSRASAVGGEHSRKSHWNSLYN